MATRAHARLRLLLFFITLMLYAITYFSLFAMLRYYALLAPCHAFRYVTVTPHYGYTFYAILYDGDARLFAHNTLSYVTLPHVIVTSSVITPLRYALQRVD